MSPGWPERDRKDSLVILSEAKDLALILRFTQGDNRGHQPDPKLALRVPL